MSSYFYQNADKIYKLLLKTGENSSWVVDDENFASQDVEEYSMEEGQRFRGFACMF